VYISNELKIPLLLKTLTVGSPRYEFEVSPTSYENTMLLSKAGFGPACVGIL
jgi:hypothetical protein